MDDIKKLEPLWDTWYVDSFLGQGSFGEVYKIRRETVGKTHYAALKIISIPHDEAEIRQMRSEMDEESMLGFLQELLTDLIREIDMMSDLRGNSNIVSFEDYKVIEKSSGTGWDLLIRMELLESLSNRMMEAPPSQAEVIKLGMHICRALEICAVKNIIHRDIKPDNIFISQYGDYKLGDFGIARQLERSMSALSKKGTYAYMAPEVYKGDPYYGTNVDTYSLGIVLYRLLNHNRLPFLPESPQPIKPQDRDSALQRRICGEKIPVLTGTSPELNALVLKACAYNREDRFESPTEMFEALDNIRRTQENRKHDSQRLTKNQETPLGVRPGPACATATSSSKTFDYRDISVSKAMHRPSSNTSTPTRPKRTFLLVAALSVFLVLTAGFVAFALLNLSETPENLAAQGTHQDTPQDLAAEENTNGSKDNEAKEDVQPPTDQKETQNLFSGDMKNPVRILIPKIGVDEAIRPANIDENGYMAVPSEAAGVTWYELYASPGWDCNAILTAHNNWYGVPGTFANLHKLAIGDAVEFRYEGGSVGRFVVKSSVTYARDDVPKSVMLNEGITRTTLITDAGSFLPSGQSSHCLVVILEQEKS